MSYTPCFVLTGFINSGPFSIPLAGMVHHGLLTLRCSLAILAASLRRWRRCQTGCGTSLSSASLQPCLPIWYVFHSVRGVYADIDSILTGIWCLYFLRYHDDIINPISLLLSAGDQERSSVCFILSNHHSSILIYICRSEEMDRLFVPGLKPWEANKVVMADIRAVHDSDAYTDAPSIDYEEKTTGSIEQKEHIGINGL